MLDMTSKTKYDMIEFARYGIRFDQDNVGTFDKDSLTVCFFITVPEHSYLVDENGVEMAGEHLAKYFKKVKKASLKEEFMAEQGYIPDSVYEEISNRTLKVKFKVREGEYWDRDHEETLTAAAFLAVTQKMNSK